MHSSKNFFSGRQQPVEDFSWNSRLCTSVNSLIHMSTIGRKEMWESLGPLINTWGFSKNRCIHKSSILIEFSLINHPFWGTPVFGNTHIFQLHRLSVPFSLAFIFSEIFAPWNLPEVHLVSSYIYIYISVGFAVSLPYWTGYFSAPKWDNRYFFPSAKKTIGDRLHLNRGAKTLGFLPICEMLKSWFR